MNFPKSGVRGFFEILMPGVFLLLNLLGTLCLLVVTLGNVDQQMAVRTFAASETYSLSLLLCLGYLLGVVLRLFRTQIVDCWSGRFIGLIKPAWRREPFITGHFFFSEWMSEKCARRFDPCVGSFYEQYWAKRDTGDPSQNTTFFNLCKAFLNKVDPASANEVFTAEALCRFVAGSCYALCFALVLALMDAMIVHTLINAQLTCIPLAVAFIYAILILGILREFRLLRCKEVNTVFDACYLNRQLFQEHFGSGQASISLSEKRRIRKRLLESVWQESQKAGADYPSIDLDALLARIRQSCMQSPFLSSLYFAGADVDHPYFLKNKALAVGLAVLPEDSQKAGHPKRHPHQTEVIFVLQGSLRLWWGNEAKHGNRVLVEGNHYVIRKNLRHWITPLDDSRSVYVFVKTNPAQEPRSQEG